MDSLQLVKDVFSTMEMGDFEKLENYLDEDFLLTGPAPQPVQKQDFLKLIRAMKTAFPDWSFNNTNMKESGDRVTFFSHITGKQTGPMDLTFMGIPAYPATNIKVKQPEEPMAVSVHEGKLTRIEVAPVEGGGIDGLLKQIGAPVPAHA